MNTFTHDAAYNFDDARNFSARRRSTAQSSAALKRASQRDSLAGGGSALPAKELTLTQLGDCDLRELIECVSTIAP